MNINTNLQIWRNKEIKNKDKNKDTETRQKHSIIFTLTIINDLRVNQHNTRL